MKIFRERLAQLAPENTGGRRWVYVPYDQLTDAFGPLSDADPDEVGIVLIESTWKAGRRPYHKQKLALILANQRHFALEQAERGVAVRYIAGDQTYAAALQGVAAELGGVIAMEPAERELRSHLEPLVASGELTLVPHEGWMTTAEQFHEGAGEVPWRMDAFYRRVRQDSGILMEDGSPAGGQYSHDGDNREPWSGEPVAPTPPHFEADAVTLEVIELVEDRFARHPGEVDPSTLPATRDDAERLWEWAKAECMELFGPFEDAMSMKSRGVFHTRISALLNIGRLEASRVVREVEALDIRLNSKEGFIRQVLGWREFVRHVHVETDGFRELPVAEGVETDPERESRDTSGGWQRWQGQEWQATEGDDGASPSFLGAEHDLPPAFWGAESGLACLDEVVESVWAESYSHHITRLMVLSNISTLLDYSPRELTDWFWCAYVDAYDWVVEPNVLGMGTFALGELFTTKPYVSGSNYINKMSDYCGECAFHPKKNCPIGDLYWAFLERHHDALDGNRRMNLIFGSLRRRSEAKKSRDAAVFEWVRSTLAKGQALHPDDLPSQDLHED